MTRARGVETTRYIELIGGAYPDVPVTLIDYDYLMEWEWVPLKHPAPDGPVYAVRYDIGPDGTEQVIFMHRQILGLAPDDPRECRHRNQNTLNNRRSNLVLLRDFEAEALISTRPRGYCWSPSRGTYFSTVVQDGIRRHLGTFDTPQEARDVWVRFKEQDRGTREKKLLADYHASLRPGTGVFSGVQPRQPEKKSEKN